MCNANQVNIKIKIEGMNNINVLLKRLSTKTSIFLLIFIVFVVLFSFEQVNKTTVYPNIVLEVNSSFLSKEYFDELTLAYERIRSSNKKWYILNNSKAIASHAILTQMMSDLQVNQALLKEHELFNTFFYTFDFHVRQLPVMTEEIHYFRNQLNTYSGAPEQIEDMLNLAVCDKWQLFSGTYHRYKVDDYDAAYNVKFISSNGRFEAVYNIKTGSLIEDAVNMGTYNYAPGSIVPW